MIALEELVRVGGFNAWLVWYCEHVPGTRLTYYGWEIGRN